MPVDHTTLIVPTDKFDGLVAFLKEAYAPLGFKEILRRSPQVVGLGEIAPYFVVVGDDKAIDGVVKRHHIAFTATDNKQVQDFHTAGLKAGGTCNGEPGLREKYHPGYYAAFVKDPVLGMNFEAVCHNGKGFA